MFFSLAFIVLQGITSNRNRGGDTKRQGLTHMEIKKEIFLQNKLVKILAQEKGKKSITIQYVEQHQPHSRWPISHIRWRWLTPPIPKGRRESWIPRKQFHLPPHPGGTCK